MINQLLYDNVLSFARAGGNINLNFRTLFPNSCEYEVDITPLEQAVLDCNLDVIKSLREFSNNTTINKAVELAITLPNGSEILPLLCDDSYVFTYKHLLTALCKQDSFMIDLISSKLTVGTIDKQTCIGILSNPNAGRFIDSILPEARRHFTDNNIILYTDKNNIKYLKDCGFAFNVNKILSNLTRDIQEHVDELEMIQALEKIKKYLIIEQLYLNCLE